MTSERVDTYLHRLQRQLQTYGLLNARIVDEARDHLIDAVEAGVQRGLSTEAAEREALSRFGTADELRRNPMIREAYLGELQVPT